MSFGTSGKEKIFRHIYKEIQNTYFIFINSLPQICTANEIMYSNIDNHTGHRKTVQRMRIVCLLQKAINTHRIGNNYLFPNTTLVARMHLKDTLNVYCLYLVYCVL